MVVLVENKIHLYTGGFFDFNNPEKSLYNIDDVSRNLAHINRFTGSTKYPYSVGQHSVYVSLLLEMWGYPRITQMIGLMHDSGEAFLNDIAKPLKNMLPDYRKIEHKVEKAIFEKYSLPFPMEACIKDADNAVFVAERQQLQPGIDCNLDVQAAPFIIVPWKPEKCYDEFLKRYYELGGTFK